MKVFEMSFKWRNKALINNLIETKAWWSSIRNMESSCWILSKIWSSSFKVSRPTLMRILIEKSTKRETQKSKIKGKPKSSSPNKNYHLNIHKNYKQIGLINGNFEDLSISEIKSEISLVIVCIWFSVGEGQKN